MDLMKKAFQLAQHQLGMPAAHAYCDHSWNVTLVHRITLQPKERRCALCGLRQRAELIWNNIRER